MSRVWLWAEGKVSTPNGNRYIGRSVTGELKLRIKLECRLNVGAHASKIYSFGSSPLASPPSSKIIRLQWRITSSPAFQTEIPPLFANICILNNRSDPLYTRIYIYIYIYTEYTGILQCPYYAVKGNENARFNAPC